MSSFFDFVSTFLTNKCEMCGIVMHSKSANSHWDGCKAQHVYTWEWICAECDSKALKTQ